jgi:hypothetical protein
VHDALEDHSPYEMTVVELRFVDLPASLGRQLEDAIADRSDALDQRRFVDIVIVREGHEPRCGRDGLENAIGKEIDE